MQGRQGGSRILDEAVKTGGLGLEVPQRGPGQSPGGCSGGEVPKKRSYLVDTLSNFNAKLNKKLAFLVISYFLKFTSVGATLIL